MDEAAFLGDKPLSRKWSNSQGHQTREHHDYRYQPNQTDRLRVVDDQTQEIADS
jgi:hypothetical protein